MVKERKPLKQKLQKACYNVLADHIFDYNKFYVYSRLDKIVYVILSL